MYKDLQSKKSQAAVIGKSSKIQKYKQKYEFVEAKVH